MNRLRHFDSSPQGRSGNSPDFCQAILRFLGRRWKIFALPFLLLSFSWFILPWLVPLPLSLMQTSESGLQYVDRHGKPLRVLMIEGRRELQALRENEIPENMRLALLAAEDKRFFQHHGIDLLAMFRAIQQNLTSGRITSGASTLTQQLVKISHQEDVRKQGSPLPKRGFLTKLYEALAARQLEMRWSKNRILTEYLNRVDYGNNFRGLSTAAAGYFGKTPDELSLAESALLAGLPQNPNRHNPRNSLDSALKRRATVLQRLAKISKIDAFDLEMARQEPVQLRPLLFGFEAPHAILQLEESRKSGNPHFPQSGVIHTTLDLSLQHEVERVVREQLHALQTWGKTQAAVVVISNQDSELRALVGSRNFFDPHEGQVNGAWALRSPGSALKPFTYALAFTQGYFPGSIIPDLPSRYMTSTGEFRPVNFDRRFHGPVTCREALGNSLNVSTVTLLNQIGGAESLIQLLKHYGISSLTQSASHYGLGLTIGNAEVRLIELTNAYAALARLGEFKPLKITHSPSLLPDQSSPSPWNASYPLSREACWLLADVLADPRARARTFGLESPIRLSFPAAVKTGTSTDYRDNWTLGYTPEWTVGVWVGNFDNAPMKGLSGVSGAGPIFAEIMNLLAQREGVSWFPPPAQFKECVIDLRLGKKIPESMQSHWPEDRPQGKEYLPEHHSFPVLSEKDYDAQGRAILPEIYKEWITSPNNRFGAMVTVPSFAQGDEHATQIQRALQNSPPQILFPISGSTFFLDPDLPNQGSKLRLEGNLTPSQEHAWSSPTLRIVREKTHDYLFLEPGRHEITLKNLKTLEKSTTWINVETR